MSMAIAHYAVGAGFTTMLLWALPYSFSYRRTIIVLGGIWALVPDLHWVLPVYAQAYQGTVHHSVLANVFWLHGVMDAIDPNNSRLIGLFSVLSLLLVTVVTDGER